MSPDLSIQRPLCKIGLVQMPSGTMRTKPWEESEYVSACTFSPISASWGSSQSTLLSTQPTRQLLRHTSGGKKSLQRPHGLPRASGEPAGNTALALYPGAVRLELDPWQATEALPAEPPWVRKPMARPLLAMTAHAENHPLPVGGAQAPSAGHPGNPGNAPSHGILAGGTEGAVSLPDRS